MAETYAFSGGTYQVDPIGSRTKLRFVNTWVAGDDWTAEVASTLTGPFTLGKGNITEQTFSCAGKLRERMFLGFSSTFAMSANNDVTGWEEQNPGASTITFLSQYGQQDDVRAFGVFEGKLVVFGRQSMQVWQVNADPKQFALLQTLDNSGTRAPLTVKSIGDLDVYYLEDSGIRSVKSKELVGNAYISDVGVAIDSLIISAQVGYDSSLACGIVDPNTKQYWVFLNGTIYALSNFPSSKIIAWSTFGAEYTSTVTIFTGPNYSDPAGTASYNLTPGITYIWVKGANDTSFSDGVTTLTETGTLVAGPSAAGTGVGVPGAVVTAVLYKVNTFTPQKFVVSNGQIFIRASDRIVYRYGGSDNNSYDNVELTVELPWLDLGDASTKKQLTGIDAAFTGRWKLQTSTDPTQTSFNTAIDRGSNTSPNIVDDSTFDKGRFAARGCGTHIKVKAISYTASRTKLGKISIVYNKANKK